MRRNTAQFLSRLKKSKSVRESIAMQLTENRYYALAQKVREDPKIVKLAKEHALYELSYYLYQNQVGMGLPQRLSFDGCRRLARTLIQTS